METQKTPKSQSKLEKEKELEESTFLISVSTTKLQSSRRYGTGTKQKYRPMEQDWKPRDKTTHLGAPHLW